MQNWKTLIHVYGKYKVHLVTLVVLGMLGAVLDGIAINIAIPSLSFLTNPNTVPTDVISRTVATCFAFFHVSFTFRHLITFITALLFVRAVVLVIFGYLRGWVTGDFLATESMEVLNLTLASSWPYLLSQKIGHMQTSLSRDVQRSSNLLEALSQFVQSSTGFLMYLLIALNISPTTTLFTIGAGATLALLIRPFLKRTQRIGQEMAETDRTVSQFVTEHLINMKAVKALGVEEKVKTTGQRLFEHLHVLYTRMSFIRSLSTSFFQPFAMIFVIILFTFTYTSGSFNLIPFAATLYLIQKIFTYLESSQASLGGTRELIPYAIHLDEFKQALVRAQEEVADGGNPFSLNESIHFDAVTFGYGEKNVLKDFTLAIEAGKTTALIGPSGSGKTSIADLLLRLFTVEEGFIRFDGMSIAEVSLSSLRSNIGYVTQEPFLLNASIADNIRFYRESVTDEDIYEGLRKAHLTQVVEALPYGIETIVGDRGTLLSGGQRQRIALARVLAGSPAVLILDEATSALDRDSEQQIQKAIDELRGRLTVIVIAHRLQTIENADSIVVLEQGSVVEQGTPAELLSNLNSYYAKHST